LLLVTDAVDKVVAVEPFVVVGLEVPAEPLVVLFAESVEEASDRTDGGEDEAVGLLVLRVRGASSTGAGFGASAAFSSNSGGSAGGGVGLSRAGTVRSSRPSSRKGLGLLRLG
jgi:hypothetical protein